ncbi:MAG TPA: mannosyltransferase, partial [Myxococcaceae bacterium]|nr:mannosyltransferase [Myxococcaceae bacterium]
EPAYRWVHGYGVQAWEWKVGLRNWAVPGVLGLLLRLCVALGIDHPRAYRAVLAIPQLLLHGWMLFAVFRYARRRRQSEAQALGAALLVGLYGWVLLFAGRTLGESISAGLLVLGVIALEDEGARFREGVWGGSLLGLAVVARYGSAVVVMAALVWLAANRRWRSFFGACVGGGAVASALGALDWVIWDRPFHSLLAYLEFNIFSGEASRRFGAASAGFYARPLAYALPLWAVVLIPAFRRVRLNLLTFGALCYLAAVVAAPHKEERFLYPGLLMLVVAAAPSTVEVISGVRARVARWGAAAVLVTMSAVGPYLGYGPDLRGDQLRAVVRAARDSDATGLLIVNEGLWGAGGFFYLGKNIPWTTCDWPAELSFIRAVNDPRFNRAVTFEGRALRELQAHGFKPAAIVGRETILSR